MDLLQDIHPLNPLHFFAFQCDCHFAKKGKLEEKHRLPDHLLSSYEDTFAQVKIGWSEEGIYLDISIRGSFVKPRFPHLTQGDSIELFFDTRDIKTSGYTTKFCHHFYFLPLPVQDQGDEIQKGEITKFRSDERHELADPDSLHITRSVEKGRSLFFLFIPQKSLYGYDPLQFNRLGFTYRINRAQGEKQIFSASEQDFTIETQPSLWASLQLLKK